MGGRKSVVCVLSSRDHRGQPGRIPTASFTLPHRGRECRTLLSPRLRGEAAGGCGLQLRQSLLGCLAGQRALSPREDSEAEWQG